ncbi:MAG TPA: GNAT family N-acetyltransferase [Chthoniobacteraceae bacterium]|jgi:GNAT superfamily N-acetyltransferase|nr:GNAT family N-acetyltransferase [Chthoniobacteraceae bacterium]
MPRSTITYLEMHSPAEIRPKPCGDARFSVRECTVKQWQFNRFLYCTVGESWSWNDKRGWTDEQWREHAESDRLRTFAAYYDGWPAGYYELHEGTGPEVEIGIFGLLPAFHGRGFGGALLTSALEEAWKMGPTRVWLHTCTEDHPAALRNYQARGLRIYKVETVETGPQVDAADGLASGFGCQSELTDPGVRGIVHS